jgi:transcription elongation factor GreA
MCPMSDVTQLSRSTYERLQAEYYDLTTRARIDIANAIERAREMGDLKENGDYHSAKDQQGMQEGRVRQLKKLLEFAEVVDNLEAGLVAVGTIVTILYEGDDEDMAEKFLVGSLEESADEYVIVSPGSPMGIALIGAHVGDTVGYKTPGGNTRVKVLAVTPV